MEALGPIAALGTLLLVGVGLARAFVRVVAPTERMVVFRAGRTDASLVRGPGRTLLLPFLDRPVLVDMDERTLRVLAVEATTADRERVIADVMVHVHVVDPLTCVINVTSLDEAVTRLVRDQVRVAATSRTATEVRDRSDFGLVVRGLIADVVVRWGAECSKIEIQRVAILRDDVDRARDRWPTEG